MPWHTSDPDGALIPEALRWTAEPRVPSGARFPPQAGPSAEDRKEVAMDQPVPGVKAIFDRALEIDTPAVRPTGLAATESSG